MKAFVAAISLLALRRIVKLAYTAPLWGPQWNNLFNEIVNAISFESDTLERYETRLLVIWIHVLFPSFPPEVLLCQDQQTHHKYLVWELKSDTFHLACQVWDVTCSVTWSVGYFHETQRSTYLCVCVCVCLCVFVSAHVLSMESRMESKCVPFPQNYRTRCGFSFSDIIHVPCEQSLLALVRLLTDSVWNAWKFTKKKTLGYLMVLKSVRIPYKANEKSKYTTRSEQIRSRWCRPHGW